MGDGHGAREANSQVNVIGDASGAIAFRAGIADHSREISIKIAANLRIQKRRTIFCREDNVDKEKG
jgi:hypothetical protein